MGLFDFFKTKEEETAEVPKKAPNRPACDLAKTEIIVELLQTPKDGRDDKWQKKFFENVQAACLGCGNPQMISGPDGFPYFVLKTTKPYNPFESFCLRNLKDDLLLSKGFGAVINPVRNDADWVFTYGDILNLHLNKEFISKPDISELPVNEKIEKDTEILMAQPSESYLPAMTKNVIKIFIQNMGIKQPKMMMICRPVNGIVIQQLAFNLFKEDFTSEDELQYRILQLSWFLPRHYSIVAFPKDSALNKNLMDL